MVSKEFKAHTTSKRLQKRLIMSWKQVRIILALLLLVGGLYLVVVTGKICFDPDLSEDSSFLRALIFLCGVASLVLAIIAVRLELRSK